MICNNQASNSQLLPSDELFRDTGCEMLTKQMLISTMGQARAILMRSVRSCASFPGLGSDQCR
jgi:hypothetical protein